MGTISQLTTESPITGSELLLVDSASGGTTKKMQVGVGGAGGATNLVTYLNNPPAMLTYSPTITGWSSFTENVVYYYRVKNMIFLSFTIRGVSDSATTRLTLPYVPSHAVQVRVVAENSGADVGTALGECTAGYNYAGFYLNLGHTSFASSGNKSVIGQLVYIPT